MNEAEEFVHMQLHNPPAIVEQTPLALLQRPAPTKEYLLVALFNTPVKIPDMYPLAVFVPPPPITE